MKQFNESKLQQSCVKWFKYRYPYILIAAFPNEGKRTVQSAARMKAEGLLSGMPDLFICFGNSAYHGLFVEMKFGNGKTTTNQDEVIAKLTKQGYQVAVVNSLDMFIETVDNYLIGHEF
jgi:hypothetical protein